MAEEAATEQYQQRSLSELFGDSEPAPATEAAPEPQPETEAKPTQGEAGDTKDEAEATPEEDGVDDKDSTGSTDPKPGSEEGLTGVPLKALQAERKKRQALEKKLAELEQGKAPEQTQQPSQPNPTGSVSNELPSIYDGQENFVQALLNKADQRTQQRIFQDRVETSQELAIKQYGEERVTLAMDTVTALSQQNPIYARRFAESRTPMLEAVKMLEEVEEHQAMQDPAARQSLRAEMRKELEKEIRAELEAEMAKERELDDAIPETTVGERSAGSLVSGGAKRERKSLTDITGGR